MESSLTQMIVKLCFWLAKEREGMMSLGLRKEISVSSITRFVLFNKTDKRAMGLKFIISSWFQDRNDFDAPPIIRNIVG